MQEDPDPNNVALAMSVQSESEKISEADAESEFSDSSSTSTLSSNEARPTNETRSTNKRDKKKTGKRKDSKQRKSSTSSSSSSDSSSSSSDDDDRDSIVILDRPKKSHKSSKQKSEKKKSKRKSNGGVPTNPNIPVCAGFLPIDNQMSHTQYLLAITSSNASESVNNCNNSTAETSSDLLSPCLRPGFERPPILEFFSSKKPKKENPDVVVLWSDTDKYSEQLERSTRGRSSPLKLKQSASKQHKLAPPVQFGRPSSDSVQNMPDPTLVVRFEMNGSKSFVGEGTQNPFAMGASGQFFFALEGFTSSMPFRMLRMKTLTITLASGEYAKLRPHNSFLVTFSVSTLQDSSQLTEGDSELLFNQIGAGSARREVRMYSCRTGSDKRLLRRYDFYATIPTDVEAVGGLALLSQQNFLQSELHFTRSLSFASLADSSYLGETWSHRNEPLYLVASVINSDNGEALHVAMGSKCMMTLDVES